MTTISADWGTLLTQASDTAESYFNRAVRHIDERFGDGYAAKNPQLIGAFMQTAAIDFATASFGKVVGEINDTISGGDWQSPC
jgi:hypothetical protein